MTFHLRSLVLGVSIGAAIILTQVFVARGDVVDSTANGFQIEQHAHIAAPPDRVYATLIEPRRWWSGEHSYSGNAANFSLDPRPGGCWCEAMPDGGGVQHMTVVFVSPGKKLRLRGGLGPFQGTAIDGAMTWTLVAAGNETDLKLEASFGGYIKGGLGELPKGVNGVLAEQVARLKRSVETGSPDSQAK